MRVAYSYDCNVIRAVAPNGQVQCIPFTAKGRELSRRDLMQVVRAQPWGRNVRKLVYLKEGDGYEI